MYDANYYVITSEFKVYICISNGSDGTSTTIGKSLFEPTSTDPNPTGAGDGSDNYKWKYLFTVSPQDVIKFDSTEYIVLPNNWLTSSDENITSVRNNAINSGQIKKVFIENGGDGYTDGTYDDVEIFGDGTEGKVSITVQDGKISEVVVSSGGSGYTFGIINFLVAIIIQNLYQLYHQQEVMGITFMKNWEQIEFFFMPDLMIQRKIFPLIQNLLKLRL